MPDHDSQLAQGTVDARNEDAANGGIEYYLRDPQRCRYDDCYEQHPVANDGDDITCKTCREYMGLDPL